MSAKVIINGVRLSIDGESVTYLGHNIGRVYKSTYTYSPPLHKGSRVARYHKAVACWRYSMGTFNGLTFKTRRAALEHLVRSHIERAAEVAK